MIEDSPPNVPAEPVPDEITELSERTTVPPIEEVNAKMVALSLSSMATTLELIEEAVSKIPTLVGAVQTLERQHDVTLGRIDECKGAANLAGSMAARALEETQEVAAVVRRIEATLDRLERNVGRVAQSVQGLEQASRSLYDSVFPERRDSPSTPPDIELADVVPIHRRVMTGE